MSNIAEIKRLASLASNVLNGKEYFLGSVIGRLQKAASKYPHDHAIRTMQLTLETRAKKNDKMTIISQGEIQSIYDDVSGLGNRVHFQEQLGDLLLENRVSKVASYNDNYINALRGDGEQISLADDSVVDSYKDLWRSPEDMVTKSAFVEGGRKGLEIELQSLGFSQPTVEVSLKNNDFVVFAAEVSSRKGRVPFLIPAEIKNGSVLMPSVFVSGNEFKDLTAENIRSHIGNASNTQKHVTAQAVVATLTKLTKKPASNQNAVFASDFGQISMNSPELLMDFVGHTNQPQQPIDDKIASVKMPEALVGISEGAVQEALVEAGLSYHRDAVLAAKAVVANELKMANVRFDTIKVASEFNGGILLATNISGKGGMKRVEIPVEISGNKPLIPSSFTSGAYAGSFDETGLQVFAKQVEGEAFDPMLNDKYDMSFNKLHKMALQKAAYGDFIESTEILSIISEKFGHDFHRIAYNDMMDLLKVGFGDEVKPMTAMERFAQEASAKAKDKESQIHMSQNSMLFYPKE